MKILVVGGVAGGASTAARLRRLDEKAEIIIFEKDENVSFSNCSLPYYLSRTVQKAQSLVMMTPESFKKRFNIDVRVNSEVVEINRTEKYVTVKTLDGGIYKETYDKLVLSPGAKAIVPSSIEGTDKDNVFTIRNVKDITNLDEYISAHEAKNITVVGGGFVGIEVVENLIKAGLKVNLVEGFDQILSPFDEDMVQTLHKELLDNGVNVYLSSMLEKVNDKSITVNKNNQKIEIDSDVVVLAIGVTPNIEFIKDAGIEISENGAIKVDEQFRTNDKNIYAVGDAIELANRITKEPGKLSLAGPAIRAARNTADNIVGNKQLRSDYIGSFCIRLFNQNAAATGLNEKAAKKANIDYEFAYILPSDKVSLMPDSNYMQFKLLFENKTGKILGAQAIGKGDVTKRIDTIATLITMGGTLYDLKELELCYSPVYSTARDVTNIAALVGINLLEKKIKQVHVDEVRKLVDANAYIVDVREPKEYENGHIEGAINIPLSEFRGHISEIPTDRPVYLHCRTSQRSYFAICELQGYGFDNVYNISGSFLGLSLYEYFKDVSENRKPILTKYNFK